MNGAGSAGLIQGALVHGHCHHKAIMKMDAEEKTLKMLGFSCREQIKSATDRRALHLAQVIKMAMDEPSPGTIYPEKIYAREETAFGVKPLVAAAGIAGIVALLVWRISHNKS